jgi:hypothetical protein
MGESGHLGDKVFAIVEHDKERAAGEVAGDELRRRFKGLRLADKRREGSERGRRRRSDPFGIVDTSQFNQPSAA